MPRLVMVVTINTKQSVFINRLYNSLQLSQRVVAITVTSVYVLDSKYMLQNRFLLSELEAVSLSPHSDGFVVFHLRLVSFLLVNLWL